jgi:hypothetical protein
VAPFRPTCWNVHEIVARKAILAIVQIWRLSEFGIGTCG